MYTNSSTEGYNRTSIESRQYEQFFFPTIRIYHMFPLHADILVEYGKETGLNSC